MHITLDALRVLDAVDRAGSFAAGAGRLGRVPSAVSYTIQKLEQDLGVVVFDRTGHRAKLTAAGTQLLSDGRELLRLAGDAERNAKAASGGRAARTCIGVGDLLERAALYPLLRAFYDAPEHADTCLQIRRGVQEDCWGALLAGESDLVIGVPAAGRPVVGLRVHAIGEVAMVLVMPRTHPLARTAGPVSHALLSRHRVLQRSRESSDGRPDVAGDGPITVGDYHSLLDAVCHGLGVGYVPESLVRPAVEAGQLVARAVADAPTLPVVAAWPEARATAPTRWFAERLRDPDVCARLIRPGA